MGNDRLPELMMFSTLEGDGKMGRPIDFWYDYVRKDLEVLAYGLALTWWKRCQSEAKLEGCHGKYCSDAQD